MKKLLFPIMLISLILTGIQAQNQSTDQSNQKVIIKKITIENKDGKESRVERTDTLDAANWKEESQNDSDLRIFLKNKDNHEKALIIDPSYYEKQKNDDDEVIPVTPPNKAVMGVNLNNVDGDNGAQIIEVFEGSAAEKAGLQEGDILLSVKGKETSNVETVIKALSDNKPGDKIKVTYLRGTKVKELKLTLQERNEEFMSSKMKCHPSCMAKMKSCNPEEMAKCRIKGMANDDKIDEQIEQELKKYGINGNDNTKIIIIKKNPGEIQILRNNGSSLNELEMKAKENRELLSKENTNSSNDKQSLNVEYLTSSPNPSNGQMKIKFSGLAVPTIIQVMDLNGKELYNEKINNFDGTYNKDIDIHNEAKGTLILKIIQGDKVITQKLIVE